MGSATLIAREADKTARRPRARDRLAAPDGVERQRHESTTVTRSRIKRFRDMRHPPYLLRMGEHRAFYDVTPGQVEIIAVVAKAEAAGWLARWGIRNEENSR